MLSFSVLSSGSKANCIYVGNSVTRILIDCGLSARETARRLAECGISAESIDAVVVTHEHRDHVAGIPVFAGKFRPAVLANEATLDSWKEQCVLKKVAVETFQTGESFAFGGLTIESFSIAHDAADPVGYRVSYGDTSIVVVTDLGHVTPLVRARIRGVSALVLESNHDPVLLQECPYPWPLKQRIASRTGHLSNQSACALVEEFSRGTDAGRLQYLVAAHISENSNHPELVRDGFRDACAKAASDFAPQILIADAYTPTPLFTVG